MAYGISENELNLVDENLFLMHSIHSTSRVWLNRGKNHKQKGCHQFVVGWSPKGNQDSSTASRVSLQFSVYKILTSNELTYIEY